MNARLLIRLILAAAVIALVVWVANNTYWEETTVPTPLRGEAATNPFYAAQRFVGHLGATSTWDRMQTSVPTNAVIAVSSWHWDLVEDRRSRMERWVEAGGRLVVDGSLVGGEDAFERWSGISRQFEDDEFEDEELAGEAEENEEAQVEEEGPAVTGRPPYRCRALRDAAASPGRERRPSQTLELCGRRGADFSHLASTRRVAWGLRDELGYQALRVSVGKGSVTVINAVPFQYRDFLEGDHAALLVAATQLRRGDEVHFLSEEEHPSLLTLMWLFGWPAVVLSLAFVALALWRRGVRFGPLAAEPEHSRRSLAEQIRGTGQFAIRFGGGRSLHAAAVRALDEAARRRVARYESLSASERIEAVARLAGVDAAALGPAVHHSGSRRAHELRDAIALIESARRRILIEPV